MSLNAAERGWGDPRRADFHRTNIVPVKVGRTKVNVHKDLAGIFTLFLATIKAKGYGFEGRADDWGYVVRPVRGYEERYRKTGDLDLLSNHSWGTALDLNATTNPMTNNGRLVTDMPDFVIGTAFGLGLSWGGYYKGARKDPMHFEWLGTRNEAQRKHKELAAFLGGNR